MARGSIALDQIQGTIITGNGQQLVTFGGGAKTAGSVLVWDAYGNAVTGTAGSIPGEIYIDGVAVSYDDVITFDSSSSSSITFS